MKRLVVIVLFIALIGARLSLLRAPVAGAAPRAQSTPSAATSTPTHEPPKPPYVFPVPVFIPTYPGDTPVSTIVPRATGQATGQDTYTVQSGDSPWIIAVKVYGDGTKYPLIMSANALTDSTRLRVGMVLKIPQVAGSAPPVAPANIPTASTPIAPVLQPTPAAVPSPTFAATPTFTPTASSIIPNSAADAANFAINILSGILALAAVVAAILAVLTYIRARRMEGLTAKKRGLQIRG